MSLKGNEKHFGAAVNKERDDARNQDDSDENQSDDELNPSIISD